MAKFIMLIGLPGCGKSTYAVKYKSKNPDTAIISSDEIREEVFGNVNDQTHNTEVFEIMKNRTLEFLKSNIDVIYDATNINRKRRISFLNLLPTNTIKIGVMFAVPFDLCKEQNEHRSRKVPFEVMNRMYKHFQVPCKGEGFDELHIEGIPEYKAELATRQLDAEEAISADCSHDNPHHSSTLGGHCLNAWKYAFEIIKRENLNFEKSYILTETCRYHDIGKWFCRQFMNSKGEHTPEAHYYGHENVSAYLYLSTMIMKSTIIDRKDYIEYILTIANLISQHMIFFSCPNVDKTLEKIYDNDFIQMLKWVHEADVQAH